MDEPILAHIALTTILEHPSILASLDIRWEVLAPEVSLTPGQIIDLLVVFKVAVIDAMKD